MWSSRCMQSTVFSRQFFFRFSLPSPDFNLSSVLNSEIIFFLFRLGSRFVIRLSFQHASNKLRDWIFQAASEILLATQIADSRASMFVLDCNIQFIQSDSTPTAFLDKVDSTTFRLILLLTPFLVVAVASHSLIWMLF